MSRPARDDTGGMCDICGPEGAQVTCCGEQVCLPSSCDPLDDCKPELGACTCVQHQCYAAPPYCRSDSDCAMGQSCAANRCTCTTSAQCGEGNTCKGSVCSAPGCTNDTECPAADGSYGVCLSNGICAAPI